MDNTEMDQGQDDAINQEKQVEFLPFNAINEFMRDEFRLGVIRTTLSHLTELPENLREPVERLTRANVKVPGFRNSAKAPVLMRVLPTVKAFTKNPELVAAILSAWAEINSKLRQQVYDLLIANEWEILPPDADRTQLPGFFTVWPKGENFETLYDAFVADYPEAEASIDNVALMAVWLTTRLPYKIEGDNKDGEDNLEEGNQSESGPDENI